MQPFLDSSEVQEDGNELRERMERDGYLFVRELLPAKILENLRLQMLDIGREAGWVKAGAPLGEAAADLSGFCVEPQPQYMQVYHRMYKLQAFHAVQHHPNLISLFERMLGEAVLPHPRIIGRIIFPQREAYTTPPHQDFIPIQGSVETYTAWFPLSAAPPELGGLQIASGSHRSGVYDFRPALGAGGLEVIDLLEDTWVNSPLEQGDVLIFHSMAVHKGLPNVSEWLRMSIDARYQKVSDPIVSGSLEPHSLPGSWKEIYAEWPPTELKYYWRQWDLEIVEYDNSYHDKRDQMGLEMAARGDQNARSTLQRIIARDGDEAKRKKAEALLAELDATLPS